MNTTNEQERLCVAAEKGANRAVSDRHRVGQDNVCEARRRGSDSTPLYSAARMNHEAAVEALLSKGAFENGRGTNDPHFNATVLYIVAEQGHEKLVREKNARDNVYSGAFVRSHTRVLFPFPKLSVQRFACCVVLVELFLTSVIQGTSSGKTFARGGGAARLSQRAAAGVRYPPGPHSTPQ